MRINLKQNHIIIELSPIESDFIAQKSGLDKSEDLSNYIESRITEALSLEKLENAAVSSVGSDFNLDKIKNVSAELKKRSKAGISITEVKVTSINQRVRTINEEVPLNVEIEDIVEDIIDVDVDPAIEDEILADLLDKNLLKGGRKQPRGGKKSS